MKTREQLIDSAIILIRELVSATVTVNNIITDPEFRNYFKSLLVLQKRAESQPNLVIDSLIDEIDSHIANSIIIDGFGLFTFNSQTSESYKLEIVNWYKALTPKEKEYVDLLRIEAVDSANYDRNADYDPDYDDRD